MEVDTDDDDILESSILRSKGPPPDVTYNLPSSTSSPTHSNNNLSSTNNGGKTNTATYAKNVKTTTSSYRSNGGGGGGGGGEYEPLLNNSGAELTDTDQMMESSEFVHLSCNHFDNDPEFSEIVKKVEFAIDHDILPQRIYEGSSGSYFAKNSDYVNIYIFF